MRPVTILLLAVLAATPLAAQTRSSKKAPASQQAPRSDEPESSSKDTQIDISPPKGDASNHPNSNVDDVMELHPYNPMKAMKAVEVGDFYFKQKNYRAALSRYREALDYKPNDAEATYKLAVTLDKTGDQAEARQRYEEYLKILPAGPAAEECKKALQRLPKSDTPEEKKSAQQFQELTPKSN